MTRAKQDGTWYGRDEEPSPYPPGVRRARFWTGFAVSLVALLVLGSVLHLVLGRPGSPFSGDVLLDSLISALFPSLLLGWSLTRGPRRKR